VGRGEVKGEAKNKYLWGGGLSFHSSCGGGGGNGSNGFWVNTVGGGIKHRRRKRERER